MRSAAETTFTIDASVHINALSPHEPGSLQSQALLREIRRRRLRVFSPTILVVEIAAALARALGSAQKACALAEAIRSIPLQEWVPLDQALAGQAMCLAARHRLRGADAVYAAVARANASMLVTLDRQQLDRLAPILPAHRPEDVLAHLEGSSALGQRPADSHSLTMLVLHLGHCT